MPEVGYPLPAVEGPQTPPRARLRTPAPARATAPDVAVARGLTVLFGAAMIASAWLLFLVQPMFAKMVLPRLGGSPAVWNTCVVFFQATLLAGYLYAHVTTRWFGIRGQALMHLGVLFVPLIALPIAVTNEPPPSTGTPVWWLLGVLTRSVGLPVFVVSTTSPLLQRWFAALPHHAARDPYFLYSSSNCASLLALLSYPAIVEPTLRLADQSLLWASAYVVFATLVVACAVCVWVFAARESDVPRFDEIARESHARGERSAAFASASEAMLGATADRAAAPAWRDRIRWVAFAFVPSSLMLGVTTYMSTDIAAVPLMWVVPLALYLATFMFVFARRPLLPARGLALLLPFLAIATLVSVMLGRNAWWLILLHLVTFFVAATVCHFRLAETRPAPRHLTEFYLWMSVGGVLGGLFNTLAAPLIFTSILEYPLALAAACALRPSPRFRRGLRESLEVTLALPAMVMGISIALWALGVFGPLSLAVLIGVLLLIWIIALAFSNRPALLGLVAAALVVLFALAPYQGDRQVLFATRSFFGVHRVVSDGPFNRLLHGGTVHGTQRRDLMATCEPTSYYHRTGPLGQVFAAVGQRFQRVGAIGLGSGNVACYSRQGQQWTFFEIDPSVERIARDGRLFTYLAIASAPVDVRLGDGRLLLAGAAPGTFDLLILDAFSSDAIPLHLVTRESIALAASRLRPDGLLAFHISNRYLDLAPVLGAIAREANLESRVNFDATVTPADDAIGKQASRWLIMSRSMAALGSLASDARWHAVETGNATEWTDDFSNILGAFDAAGRQFQ